MASNLASKLEALDNINLAPLLLPLFVFGTLAMMPLFGYIVLLRARVRRRMQLLKSSAPLPLRVAFVHPDLGIGGAERLVVDAAVALRRSGHQVEMFTARHTRDHCFEETRDGTLRVTVYGDFLPRRIMGRFYAACAYLRMCWVSLRIVLEVMQSSASLFDVLIVDQVSICLPILRLAQPSGIIFYCHYPDYLLTGRQSLLKRLYRAPLDALEEWTTGRADVVYVNSEFTAGVFAEAFPRLRRKNLTPSVLYPALNLQDQDKVAAEAATAASEGILGDLKDGEALLLSINRFERKKNIGLAVRCFAALPKDRQAKCRLVLAGGYDEKLPENVEHAAELEALAKELGVADRVTQMRSVPSVTKAALLRRASCLLYTPDKEHFGIVPVEAMYARVPVVAVNSGGPLESIADGETGFLRPPEPDAWAECVERVLREESLRRSMGEAGRARASERFSLEAFGRELDDTVRRLAIHGATLAAAAGVKMRRD
eukprot:TRINITY_DN27409_c0_g1_i1.p1 TRINITY_DN27409_c0_g1~~TRINITY_DN27409_c0_g1_i1.p1  ORF type:complete len:486 (-),score=117.96 TRINITY_DN27409_c0_g1_i1:234-1691(-)